MHQRVKRDKLTEKQQKVFRETRPISIMLGIGKKSKGKNGTRKKQNWKEIKEFDPLRGNQRKVAGNT